MRTIFLVHAPTPLVRFASLDAKLGVELWVKRDDATGGAESGNKVRKLEFLLSEALRRKADTVLTCGGLQSNHARATAITAAQLGLSCILFLRDTRKKDDNGRFLPLPLTGNVLLDRLVGAEIRPITADEYAQRNAVMQSAALELERRGKTPFIIPEGGSNGLGSLGYVEAMREVRAQLDLGLGGRKPFDVIVHACGSGGTAAGIALGAARFEVAPKVLAFAVCDDAPTFHRVIDGIMTEARAYDRELSSSAELVVDDTAKGPGYAVMNAEQRAFVRDIARASGLVLDPVYTGKALFGLSKAAERGEIPRGARVLFVHTGGLPGLLAQGEAFADEL